MVKIEIDHSNKTESQDISTEPDSGKVEISIKGKKLRLLYEQEQLMKCLKKTLDVNLEDRELEDFMVFESGFYQFGAGNPRKKVAKLYAEFYKTLKKIIDKTLKDEDEQLKEELRKISTKLRLLEEDINLTQAFVIAQTTALFQSYFFDNDDKPNYLYSFLIPMGKRCGILSMGTTRELDSIECHLFHSIAFKLFSIPLSIGYGELEVEKFEAEKTGLPDRDEIFPTPFLKQARNIKNV
jgi:hypothetical protein